MNDHSARSGFIYAWRSAKDFTIFKEINFLLKNKFTDLFQNVIQV